MSGSEEYEIIQTYVPNQNVYIGNPLGAEVDYGLFSIKNDKTNSILINDDGYDVSLDATNLDMHRRWLDENRGYVMEEFNVTEWEPDLTF